MIRVYICHPYTADPEGNVKKVKRIVKDFAGVAVAKMQVEDARIERYDMTCDTRYNDVHIPVSPMLAFPDFMSEVGGISREHAMAFCLSLLEGCEELWVCSRHISDGMAEEISHAAKCGIRIVWKD